MAPTAKLHNNNEASSSAAAISPATAAATMEMTQPPPPHAYTTGCEPPLLLKGTSFPDGKAAVRLVQDYALHHNKQVRVACRGGKHRKLICTSETCPFYVQFYQRHSKNGDRSWYLSSFDTTHSANCTSSAKPTRRQLIEMTSFKEALASTPSASAASLATYVGSQSHVPLRMNLRTVYRAKEALRHTLLDRQARSFRRIRALLSQFLSVNDGSYATHDVDENGCFVRAFIACGVFCKAAHNQQIFGFECIPVEGTFPGVHLYLLGKDGNRKTLVIAAAVISVEMPAKPLSVDHLTWFFRCVQAAGVEIQSCPIVSSLGASLLEVEAELGLKFRLCTRHLIETELATIPAFSSHHHALISGLQASETVHEYNNRLQWITTTCGEDAAALLRQYPIERWAIAGPLNERQAPLYGWRTRDFSDGPDRSEPFHALVKRLETKLPVDFLDGLMENWVQAAYERSASYKAWTQSGLQITPGARELYDGEVQRISDFMVTRSSSSVAFVSPVQSDSTLFAASAGRCRVDLNANTCTCAFMQQHGIPCRHMIAVVLFCGQMDAIYSRFAPCYSVASYGAAYHDKVVELPLQEDLTESDGCLPPRRPAPRARGATGAVCSQPADAAANAPKAFDGLLAEPQDRGGSSSSAAGGRPRKRSRPANSQPVRIVAVAELGGEATAHRSSTLAPVVVVQPRTVRCSNCKRTGHNARSCTMNS